MVKTITPNLKTTVRDIVKDTQVLTKKTTNSIVKTRKKPEISAARMNLELKAEDMSPEDYLRARSYLEQLEYSAMVISESLKF